MTGNALGRASGMRHPLIWHLFPSSLHGQVRSSSLSAIHRGVRRSQKAQAEDAFTATLMSRRRGSEWEQRGRRTAKAMDGISSPRQAQKLRKKLDAKAREREEAGEEESTRQTRRKRFLDPSKSFGKSSFVYQVKQGALSDEMSSLRQPERPAPYRSIKPQRGGRDGPSSALERAIWGEEASKPEDTIKPGPRLRSALSGDRDSPRRRERPLRSRRSEESERLADSGRLSRRSRDWKPSSETETVTQRPRSNDRENDEDQGDDDFHGRRRDLTLTPIKYTTAASQFLYGKSVVKAALEQHRRKLYNLYIYAGEARKDSKDDETIASMAKSRGVPVTMVPRSDQSMMDKMSMGRPHNGFILEASPLQQPPITSLGRLEESFGKLGFHVDLGYQSKEEEAVNGRGTFVARKSSITPKPFVLLLSEILDPGNLGGLLRTASYLGVDAVVMTNRSSATLTPVVLKSAAGAAEEVSIFTVDSPVEFIERSKQAGWKTYAAVAPPGFKLAKMHHGKFISTEVMERSNPLWKNPCILVLGNEGHGLSKQMKMAADYELSVPRFVQNSSVDSLNVSVAAGLLCHAFVKAPTRTRAKARRSQEAEPRQTEDGLDGEVKREEELF